MAREFADDDWHRCFIALVPDRATRDALAALPVGQAARRVGVDQLHMTLAFLGSVPPEKGQRLAERLGEIVAPLPPPCAQRAEYWPSAAHPRLVVVPFVASPALAGLEARVRAFVTGLQLPVDDHRPFRPHITLARFARSARTVNSTHSHRQEPSASMGRERLLDAPSLEAAMLDATPRFESLTLYSSTLARHGARYRALASAPVPLA